MKVEINMSREEYIQFLSNKSNLISMTNNNKKTGMGVLTLSLPAIVTCRSDAPCKAGCYACKGTQTMCSVLGAYHRNLRLYNENPENFFEQFYYSVKFSGISKVRLFDSGDIPDYRFFDMLCKTISRMPDVKFMGFTKKYEIVNAWLEENGEKLPENLNILFSAWDKNWAFANPYNLGVAYVNFDNPDLNPEIPSYAFKCKGKETTCSACGACWNKNLRAVVFHQH